MLVVDTRRRIPRTDTLLAQPPFAEAVGRLGAATVKQAITAAQDQARRGEIAPEEVPDHAAGLLPASATTLQPVITRFTQTAKIQPDRILANAIEAAEQCEVLNVPEVRPAISLDRLIAGWGAAHGYRLLVFAGHDSDPARASQVPHSAFVNPQCPPGTPTRLSVECRCFAYW